MKKEKQLLLLSVSENAKLARRLLVLCRHVGIRTYQKHDDPDFTWIDFGEHEPGQSWCVSHDGMVIEHRCEYSGHNGDPYANEYELLTPQRAHGVLVGMCNIAESRALKAEVRLLEEHAQRRLESAARKNLEAKLKGQ